MVHEGSLGWSLLCGVWFCLASREVEKRRGGSTYEPRFGLSWLIASNALISISPSPSPSSPPLSFSLWNTPVQLPPVQLSPTRVPAQKTNKKRPRAPLFFSFALITRGRRRGPSWGGRTWRTCSRRAFGASCARPLPGSACRRLR